MHATHRRAGHQQKCVQSQGASSDSFRFFDLLTSPELLDKVNALLPDQSFGARDWNSGQVATARVCPVWAGVSCRFHILESPLEWTNDSC